MCAFNQARFRLGKSNVLQQVIIMSPVGVSLVVFACVFGAALLGVFGGRLLPETHQSPSSKEIVRLGMGLVATTVALVLGLLVASAKNFYDTQNTELTQFAANFVLLDRILEHYGPEAGDTRDAMRSFLADELESLGPSAGPEQNRFSSPAASGETAIDKIQELSPKDDYQRSLKVQALNLSIQLGQTRWLIYEQKTLPIPRLLVAVLIVWLMMLFLSFGIFAPRNLTVLAGLFLSAMAVCGALLLMFEMYHPYSGFIRISDAPLRAAMMQLGN